MKILLILVLVISLALAKPLEESPEVKKHRSSEGTGKQDKIASEPKSQSRSRYDLKIRSHKGMTRQMREDVLDIVGDTINDDKEGIADYTYRALNRKHPQWWGDWTCIAGEDWHAESNFYMKILIEDLGSDMFVFCFV